MKILLTDCTTVKDYNPKTINLEWKIKRETILKNILSGKNINKSANPDSLYADNLACSSALAWASFSFCKISSCSSKIVYKKKKTQKEIKITVDY